MTRLKRSREQLEKYRANTIVTFTCIKNVLNNIRLFPMLMLVGILMPIANAGEKEDISKALVKPSQDRALTSSKSVETFNGTFDGQQEFEWRAKKLVKDFSTELKKQLQQAIKSGGFEQGIVTCEKQAPLIAKQFSINGWKIKRVSNKNRNVKNKADEQEQAILELFAKMTGNEKPYHKTVERDDELIYYSSIHVQPLCLACHGDNLSEDVRESLMKAYPEDKATGYQLGDLRGMFVVEYLKSRP